MENQTGKSGSDKEWLLPAIVIAILIFISLPPFNRVSEKSPLTIHISNARQLITVLRIYSSDHEGTYPSTMDDLVKEGVVEKDSLDRLMRYELAPDGKPRDWVVNLDLIDSAPGDLPVVVSPAPTKSGTYILCMNDSSVVTVGKKEYDDALEHLRKFREERDKKKPSAGR